MPENRGIVSHIFRGGTGFFGALGPSGRQGAVNRRVFCQTCLFRIGSGSAPLINKAKISMECTVEDIYETKGFDNFILTIDHTYVEEGILNEARKIDYDVFKPILFEMPGYTYLKTGETAAKCMTLAAGQTKGELQL